MDIIGLVIDVAELGLDLVLGRPKRPSRRWECALLWMLLGGVAAMLSVPVAPDLLIRDRIGQAIWLLTAPLVAGLAAGVAGRWGSGWGFSSFRFTCAWLFLLAFSLLRIAFCH